MAASDPSFAPILLTLPSLTPSLALEVLPAGLTLHRLFVQADGKTHDILIGPEDPAGHITQKYTNTIIGRYANRLPVGSFAVERNGIHSVVSPKPNEAPTVSLHGGPKGFDQYPWEPLVDPSTAELFTPAELATIQTRLPTSIIFKRISEDGEEGYPGRLLIEVLVGLAQPEGPANPTADGKKEWNLGSVLIVYRAKLLDEKKVTPINLTQHWGFNLDASLQDGPDPLTIKDHTISLKADHTVELNSEALSTGTLLPVAGTHHAHAEKSSGRIGEQFPEQGYDEFYLFSARAAPPPPSVLPASELTPELDLVGAALSRDGPAGEELVSLASGKSGLRLGFASNQPGVQFYSNNLSVPEKGARKKIHGGSGAIGDGYPAGTAAFLEFHAPLAAWIHPQTRGPTGEDSLLASGEVYNNFVRLDVWYREGTASGGN
ncbi:galactose mutarotase-like protein [Trametes versicolor FP-101664 SS1]|uniref:galactose mutarotase-like protein n=1 Tax=Trametes versicolor (strain FP-101664) TaxID=717944 RepID=UPI0004623F79|nr:galactose mutarotase-like protein [Trametes versicolor FP-101664 SS1]EIW57180.1 galactose mutarotase-like protein [Trametes versicolor FP-101664 SS1]